MEPESMQPESTDPDPAPAYDLKQLIETLFDLCQREDTIQQVEALLDPLPQERKNELIKSRNSKTPTLPTPLITATYSRNREVMEKLIQEGADVNATDYFGFTSLLAALTVEGAGGIIDLLLAHGANIDHRENRLESTALMHVARSQNTEYMDILLNYKPDIEIINCVCKNALTIAQECNSSDISSVLKTYRYDRKKAITTLFVVIDGNQTPNSEMAMEAVRKFLHGNWSPDAININYGKFQTALMIASKKGWTDVVGMLLSKGADVNRVDIYGFSSLLYAAYNGHTDIVGMLLDKGAAINQTHASKIVVSQMCAPWKDVEWCYNNVEPEADEEGKSRTALMLASICGERSTVELLLTRGAHVGLQDADGKTAKGLVMSGHDDIRELLNDAELTHDGRQSNERKDASNILTDLFNACRDDDFGKVEEYFQNNGDYDVLYKDHTPLLKAAFHGSVSVVKYLLRTCSVNVNARATHGNTSLIIACMKGYDRVVKPLLTAGVYRNQKNGKGDSALIIAAVQGSVECVKLLCGDRYSNIIIDKVKIIGLPERTQCILMAKLLQQAADRSHPKPNTNVPPQPSPGPSRTHMDRESNIPVDVHSYDEAQIDKDFGIDTKPDRRKKRRDRAHSQQGPINQENETGTSSGSKRQKQRERANSQQEPMIEESSIGTLSDNSGSSTSQQNSVDDSAAVPAPVSPPGDVTVSVGNLEFINRIENILGYGSTMETTVWRGVFKDGLNSVNPNKVAIKVMQTEKKRLTPREKDLLIEARPHENVIRYVAAAETAQFQYLALELCAKSLKDWVTNKAIDKSIATKKDYLRQTARGIRHLHSINIVHRDLRPSKILLCGNDDNKMVVKVSGFDHSKKVEGNFELSKEEKDRRTTQWMAQERLRKKNVTNKVDIFSLGCIVYYVITDGKHPFGDDTASIHKYITTKTFTPPLTGLSEDTSDNLIATNLISNMVKYEPSCRPSAVKVCEHMFFWEKHEQLDFILEVFTYLEDRNLRQREIDILEENRARVWIGDSDWISRMDEAVKNDLKKVHMKGTEMSKRDKYKHDSLFDLMRVIRNKKVHYFHHSTSATVRQKLGELPDEFMDYFTLKFPQLLIYIYTRMDGQLDQRLTKRFYGEIDKNHIYTLRNEQ